MEIRRNILIISLSLLLMGGCVKVERFPSANTSGPLGLGDFTTEPKIRIGYTPNPSPWTRFPEPSKLGQHGYGYNSKEKNGIIYTCRGGHIDLVHLRNSADWTAYLSAKSYENIIEGKTQFSFKLAEPSVYYVTLNYPQGWEKMPEATRMVLGVHAALDLGQYLAYTAGIWHEMLTWYGFKLSGLYSERSSAFSWEDTYSNLLGILLAKNAICDSRPYEKAMTSLLDLELYLLGIQSAEIARETAENIKGKKFPKKFFYIDMMARNFDIGIDDGLISPWVAPSPDNCNEPQIASYPAPDLDLSKYGFSAKVEIEPKEWEKNKILKIVHKENKEHQRIEPAVHFPVIMEQIIQEANQRHDLNNKTASTVLTGHVTKKN